MIKFIKKYLPDIIIISGIFILAYNIFIPLGKYEKYECQYEGYLNCHKEWMVLAIVLIAVGIDIAVRRYLVKK